MNDRPPLPSSNKDTLTPAEHRAHIAQRKAEQGTRTSYGYIVEPAGPPRGAVVDRYLANVRARRAEQAAALNIVVLPDPPADLRVGDPQDDLCWESVE